TADAEDSHTRLTRVEIHLKNEDGRIRSGMFGRVRIILDRSNDPMTVPVSCLVGTPRDNRGQVYVVRDGKAFLVQVELGANNGTVVGVRSGLSPQDEVVANPSRNLQDGGEVEVEGQAAHH